MRQGVLNGNTSLNLEARTQNTERQTIPMEVSPSVGQQNHKVRIIFSLTMISKSHFRKMGSSQQMKMSLFAYKL